MIELTEPQEFALLALKHFSPERPCRVIRASTLQALVRKGLAVRHDNGSFSITPRGVAVNDMTPPAGWEHRSGAETKKAPRLGGASAFRAPQD